MTRKRATRPKRLCRCDARPCFVQRGRLPFEDGSKQNVLPATGLREVLESEEHICGKEVGGTEPRRIRKAHLRSSIVPEPRRHSQQSFSSNPGCSRVVPPLQQTGPGKGDHAQSRILGKNVRWLGRNPGGYQKLTSVLQAPRRLVEIIDLPSQTIRTTRRPFLLYSRRGLAKADARGAGFWGKK